MCHVGYDNLDNLCMNPTFTWGLAHNHLETDGVARYDVLEVICKLVHDYFPLGDDLRYRIHNHL